MQNKAVLFGIGILGIIAYLHIRSKRGSSISTIDPIKEIEFRNLQKQEKFLTKELETDIFNDLSRISQLERYIAFDNLHLSLIPSGFKIEEKEEAARVRKSINIGLERSRKELEVRKLTLFANVGERIDILDTQTQYSAATLSDIRQRLNSDEYKNFNG